MIKHTAIIVVAALLSTAAFADIHKWTDKDGVVHYSDTIPQGMKPGAVKTMKDPEAQVVKSEMYTAKPTNEYNKPKAPDPVLAVTSPGNNAFIRDNTGTVTISGTAKNVYGSREPELVMDGKVIAKGYNPTITLSNVDRGTHTVQMRATGANGKVYASKPVSFTLQRAHKQ